MKLRKGNFQVRSKKKLPDKKIYETVENLLSGRAWDV